jgi:hypothetical protein
MEIASDNCRSRKPFSGTTFQPLARAEKWQSTPSGWSSGCWRLRASRRSRSGRTALQPDLATYWARAAEAVERHAAIGDGEGFELGATLRRDTPSAVAPFGYAGITAFRLFTMLAQTSAFMGHNGRERASRVPIARRIHMVPP